jgi:hypothetical protein
MRLANTRHAAPCLATQLAPADRSSVASVAVTRINSVRTLRRDLRRDRRLVSETAGKTPEETPGRTSEEAPALTARRLLQSAAAEMEVEVLVLLDTAGSTATATTVPAVAAVADALRAKIVEVAADGRLADAIRAAGRLEVGGANGNANSNLWPVAMTAQVILIHDDRPCRRLFQCGVC